eukprot:CAMPEP_0114615722 /NCGR_PEP_ID=MMETSP0168-20121206/6313_1 /TAXON_ID=95228 ORGANISM="Vannella sp., Strain DIVA3 517/6/12" /NCGR_SAMPLE_ID=MMETSP0168 /ASSEMBLY_ACC=CAM_ASM_000044 /LENGTH=178 /DNA_ID=CAMNT_0001826805 /DNA_START=222 /DNA_END=759 /DNA_ORIENTATION=-
MVFHVGPTDGDTTVLSVDGFHFLLGQVEPEDVDVLPQMQSTGSLRNCDNVALQAPSKYHLRGCHTVAACNRVYGVQSQGSSLGERGVAFHDNAQVPARCHHVPRLVDGAELDLVDMRQNRAVLLQLTEVFDEEVGDTHCPALPSVPKELHLAPDCCPCLSVAAVGASKWLWPMQQEQV